MQRFYKQNRLAYEVSITRLDIPEEPEWNSFSVTGEGSPARRTIGRLNPLVDTLNLGFAKGN